MTHGGNPMKRMMRYNAILFSLAVVFISGTILAQPSNVFSIKVLPGSRMWVEGDSTLHRYHSSTPVIGLQSEIVFKSIPVITEGRPIQAVVTDGAYNPRLRWMTLSVAVKNFHSSIVGFDSQFHKTLKHAEHPNITFTLSNYKVEPESGVAERYVIRTNGVVRIAGKEKEITVTSIGKLDGQHASVTGQTDLLMTDFMIDPPKLLFVSTDNKVTIKWNLKLTLEPKNTALLSEK